MKKSSAERVNELFEKLWMPKVMDFILRKRFCNKHLREFIKKNKLQKRKDLNVAQLPSICSVCKKPTICYYIEGNI